MFYGLANAQSLKVFLPLPPIAYFALANAPTLAAEISSADEEKQLVDVVATLIMEEAPSSPIPTKRGMDEDQSFI